MLVVDSDDDEEDEDTTTHRPTMARSCDSPCVRTKEKLALNFVVSGKSSQVKLSQQSVSQSVSQLEYRDVSQSPRWMDGWMEDTLSKHCASWY